MYFLNHFMNLLDVYVKIFKIEIYTLISPFDGNLWTSLSSKWNRMIRRKQLSLQKRTRVRRLRDENYFPRIYTPAFLRMIFQYVIIRNFAGFNSNRLFLNVYAFFL